MKRPLTCLLATLLLQHTLNAQTGTFSEADSTAAGAYAAGGDTVAQSISRPLPEAVVHAFELGQGLQSSPASVGIVSERMLRRFANASVVPAINTVPGVRMDERSPGSYRLAIRGSSLRAPFGVRNVKIYYSGIPFTDPGGNTYLNQLGTYNISSLEIIKGPGSSLYGAGTGGVVLIESAPAHMETGLGIEATAGSFGLIHLQAEARQVDSGRGLRSIVRYQHLSSDGYREHSALRRDVISWDAEARLSEATRVNTHFFYTDLAYETPGALTLSEYEASPQSARPSVGAVPGAVAMNAGVKQKAFLAGATLHHAINARWKHSTTLYGAFTDLENPTLRNYARSHEPHAGGRFVLKYSQRTRWNGRLEWLIGAEAQAGGASTQVYSNSGGQPDTIQSDDKVQMRPVAAFTQAAAEWGRWLLTAGVSLNNHHIEYARLSSTPYAEATRDFKNEVAPRLALRYRLQPQAVFYGSIARGFSPPTSTELSPTGGVLNASLEAERGWNYEAGVRGAFWRRRMSYELTGYYFSLLNTIVQRRDIAGGDFFINSGSTRQAGAEALLRYLFLSNEQAGELSAFASYSYQHYRYRDFKQLDVDYSGNAMPGVSPHIVAAGLDWDSPFGLSARLSYYFCDEMPLNDANSALLPASHLLGARIGYTVPLKGAYGVDVFCGGDNLTNVAYSAGPDINAFGGRYYNAAPERNFYAGVSLQYRR